MKITTFENYDPQSINDIVFTNSKSESLVKDIVSGAFPFPRGGKTGTLFYGPPGTGKSALATLLPDAMEMVRSGYPSNFNYFPVTPGANGMKMLGNIQNQAQLIPSASHHYFVLDEVDNLTAHAMTILKSVMNTPACIFIMTTNNLNKIDQAVQDRCHLISFHAAPSQNWLPLAHRMLADAGISTISDQMLINVINPCNGSARQIIDAITCVILAAKRNTKPINSATV